MDPKAPKPLSKRTGQDPEKLPTRHPNRLFLSETIPPAIHQSQLSQDRTHNLSDRIHEYYENLVKNSSASKTYPSRQSPQFMPSNLQERFEDPYLVDRSLVTVPRYAEQPHPSVSIRSALQPSNTNRQPYTVYVEDPAGAFQQYSKGKPPLTNKGRSAYLEASDNKTDVSAENKAIRERSKSPVVNRTQCVLCHSSNHSSQNCNLQSRIPAEHDGFFSDPIQIGSMPPVRHSKGSEENQGDGSEGQKKAIPKKRPVPANINVRCERDVIGQEKSPVSKSHPVSSGALSTSSSNCDTAPRERKKWVRPPLVGQAASSADKTPFMNFDCLDDKNRSLEKRRPNNDSLQLSSSTGSDQIDSREAGRGLSYPKSSYFDSSNVSSGLPQNEDFFEPVDHDVSSAACQQHTSEGEQGLSDSCAGGRVSPSSSVTSSRRLEWDSGADVGYSQMYGAANPGTSSSGLCTIERMALAQGCSVALHLRLDPEGTTVPASPGTAAPVLPSPTPAAVGKPTAESTPLGQAPHVAKALRKHGNHPKNVISPIFYASKKNGAETQDLSGPLKEEEKKKTEVNPVQPLVKSPDAEEYSSASTVPFHRQLSNSMQDLRKCISKQSENQLLKSQSDPDLSGDIPVVSKSPRTKLLKEMPRSRNYAESNVAAHSISSGSDATLVHVGTEEDLATDGREDNDSVEHPTCVKGSVAEKDSNPSTVTQDPHSVSMAVSASGKVSAPAEPQDSNESSKTGSTLQQDMVKKDNVPPNSKESKPVSSGNSHVCSDTDHKRGLHHHFGVLCSTAIGGHIHSAGHPNVGSQPQNVVHGPDKVYCANESQQSREPTQSSHLEGSENPLVESTGSSAFHSDAPHDDSMPNASTLTGRANSFEYLPGHAYGSNPAAGLRKHERPPGISTSTETDSEPARPMSRVTHRKVMDSSSHDTEDDRLWGSPRTGSNTLVQDLERGVNLLKGVMENKSAGRRCKRELIRRIIKKLVTSEYVEDIIEKERVSHAGRTPFSPRRIKYHERQDRNLRSKRTVGSERQEISGESDEPKQQAARVHNVRRKLQTHQPVHQPPAPRTLSTLASGSKSSSLWSSHGDSTSGSISLSGSSDNQKQSKISVKPNPLFELNQDKAADWLKPATKSEKLFEMRKNGASHAEKHLAGLIGTQPAEHTVDPMLLKDDPQKQLSWVTNEINHLKILKQLLQKQELLKQSLNPNLCQTNYTTMPLTGIKQTMQMADCTSPDIPEARSPALKPSRLQQWISLESDTSAGFGLSNNTGSSHDSHWQGVEVASAGEQDSHPHRTVSISDGDQITDASCSLSNRKSDVSHSSGPKIAPKSRRRSVSISDTDHQLRLPSTSDAPIQKKRSDCHCGRQDGRTFSTRPPQVATYGPPSRNLIPDSSTKQVCENCATHSHMSMRNALPPGAGLKSALVNRPGGSLGLQRFDNGAAQSDDRNQNQSCTCGSSRTQARSCCCSKEQPPGDKPQNASKGPLMKGTSGLSHQLVPMVAEMPSVSTQPISGGGIVRVHIESGQDVDLAHDRPESLRSSIVRDRAHLTDVSEYREEPLLRPSSDDSITKAVTHAVSSKVKALRNMGQIEEAEVKIRVKVAPGVSDSAPTHPERGRVLKTQDLDDENPFHPSKHTELDEMIERQRAMDYETRQKLLSIAESRQRAQMGLHDVDRRIQDLLLQDYLSRQFKTQETASTPHTRLNVRVEAPVSMGSSIGVQSEIDKKTIGTSTADQKNPQQRDAQSYTGPIPQAQQALPLGSGSRGVCICGGSPARQAPYPYQGQQTEIPTRPQTAPASRSCCCGSQPTSTPRTYHASPPFSTMDRQVEFELDLRKPRPCKMTPHDVHEALKSRNTAYFLQFEEDASAQLYPEKQEAPKPPMEVVTVKIPMQKPSGVKPTLSSQGRKKSKNNGNSRSPADSKHIGSSRSPAGSTAESKRNGRSRSPAGSPGSPHSNQSNQRVNQGQLSGSESPTDAANLLRSAPGRSHLSITITDSSGESVFSPDGDSRYSSYQHRSRKVHRSPRPNRRTERVATDKDAGDISQTLVFRSHGSKATSSNLSSQPFQQPKHTNRSANDSVSVYGTLDDADIENCVPTLQEYLEKNHPKYLDAAEKRRRCIAEMSYLRRLRQQSRKRLMELEGDKMCARQKQQWRIRCVSRAKPAAMRKKIVPKVTRSACARKYMFLPENQQRMAEMRKKEEKRTNRLMAEIYTRKLQEKVLKGSATIRSSVSVISSL